METVCQKKGGYGTTGPWEKDKYISIHTHTYINDCTWKETPPPIYMEVTVPDQILNPQSPISAKMSGMKWSCSYCNVHDDNSTKNSDS